MDNLDLNNSPKIYNPIAFQSHNLNIKMIANKFLIPVRQQYEKLRKNYALIP
jgi:hypothetical protein